MILLADVNSLYSSVGSKFGGKRLDYSKLLALTSTFGRLRRATAYGTTVGREAVGFITCLKRFGYEVKFKRTDGLRRLDWSVGIVLDVVNAALNCDLDSVVVATSSPNVADLATWVRARGIRFVVVGCGISREVADVCVEITEELLEDA